MCLCVPQGLLTPLLGAMAENATLFVSYGAMKRLMGVDKLPEKDVRTWQLLACGAGSGVAVSFVLTPVELVKCKLQAQQGSDARFSSVKYSGPLGVVRDVVRQEGVRGLWKGNLATTLREIPGNMAWFGVYELLCKAFMKPGQSKEDLKFGVSDASRAFVHGSLHAYICQRECAPACSHTRVCGWSAHTHARVCVRVRVCVCEREWCVRGCGCVCVYVCVRRAFRVYAWLYF